MLLILEEYFKDYPARKKVVETLYNYGLSIRDGKVYLDKMEVPISVIARFANVNRKIVYHTIEFIEKDYALRGLFERLKPCVSLHELAPLMGWEVIEMTVPHDGLGCIMKDAIEIITSSSCSIRQIHGYDDKDDKGQIVIIMESSVPIEVIEKLKDIPRLESITIKTSEKDKMKLICHHCKVKLCPRRI